MNSNNNEKITIVLADHHKMMVELMKDSIQSKIDNCTVYMANDYEALTNILSSNPDIDLVLLNNRMPGVNNIQGVKWLLKNHPNTATAILSEFVCKSEVDEFLLLGAAGFIPKTLGFRVLVCAINLMLSGEKYSPMNLYKTKNHTNKTAITSRELEVLRKLHIGYSNKQVAASLKLQEVTIKMYVSRLFKKLSSTNRTQLVINALNQGVLN